MTKQIAELRTALNQKPSKQAVKQTIEQWSFDKFERLQKQQLHKIVQGDFLGDAEQVEKMENALLKFDEVIKLI